MAINVNYRLANSITGLFSRNINAATLEYATEANYSSNNVFNRFVVCDLTCPIVEIPVVIGPWFRNIVVQEPRERAEIVLPLVEYTYVSSKRTADSIIKMFFDSNPKDGMLTVITSKGIKYYGGYGYILDSNYNPLLVATSVGKFLDTGVFEYSELRVYIHPSVIINDSDLIGKGIMKKVLPVLLSTTVNFNRIHRSIRETVLSNVKVKIIIEDRSDLFRTPVPMNDFSDAALNELLNLRVEEVVNQIVI